MMTDPILDHQEDGYKELRNNEFDRNRTLTFYLDIIPIILLALGFYWQYTGAAQWRPTIAAGAILACIIYCLSSWFLLWKRQYGKVEWALSGISLLFFLAAGYTIYLQFYNMEEAYLWKHYTKWAGMALLAIVAVGFLVKIRNNNFNDYYRRLLTRILILTAIFFKGNL